MTAVLLAALGFLFGSFPSGVVLSRLFLDRDVREVGSGNIGAANAARAGGLRFGIAVGALDALKGIIPVLIGHWLGVDATVLAIVALAAVVGHDFSIFLRFRGGKGVATTMGAAVALAPLATLLSGVAWLIVVGISAYTSLASLVALALLPVFLALTHQPVPYVIVGVALFLLTAGKHAGNISRLMSGTEASFRRSDVDGS